MTKAELQEEYNEAIRVLGICAKVMEERAGTAMLHPSSYTPFEEAAALARHAFDYAEERQ